MSFSAHARRVRDASLPYAWRVSSLRSCVEQYQPLGWHATLSFLRHVAGAYEHDEEALLQALEVLSRSRRSRRAAQQTYAERRRREKAGGRRTPRRDDPDPVTFRLLWFGDEAQEATLHALQYQARAGGPLHELRASPAPGARELVTVFDACLTTGGALTDGQRQWLDSLLDDVSHRLTMKAEHPVDYPVTSAMFTTALTLRDIGDGVRWAAGREGTPPTGAPGGPPTEDDVGTDS